MERLGRFIKDLSEVLTEIVIEAVITLVRL